MSFNASKSFYRIWINPLLSNRFFVGVGDDASVLSWIRILLCGYDGYAVEGVHFLSEIDPFRKFWPEFSQI